MELRELGQTGLRISPLGLGTVKFGRNQGVKYPAAFTIPEEGELAALLDLAKDLGINLLDTAPAYGTSEERLGRLLHSQREDWVIIGKAGEEFENGVSRYDFTPAHLEMSLTRTLKRLGTEYIDVLLVHSDGNDLQNLSDEVLKVMQGFKQRGLVRATGASTKTTGGGIRALEALDVAMATYTPTYLEEQPVLDYAAARGKGVLLKKVLSSGHAEDIQNAFAHAFAHPGVSAAIVGTINPEHLRENVRMVEAVLNSPPERP